MQEFDYNTKYYEGLLENCAGTAKQIADVRWKFVEEVDAKTILDYGCGCNFLTIFAPDGTDVDSYDVGHIGDSSYPQSGINKDHYDLIFFNDVLEHVDWANVPDTMIEDMIRRTNWVAVAVPMLPDNVPLIEWKHFKPGEHLTYFTEESLDEFFAARGFIKVKSGYPECPPREDILSVLYKRDKEPLQTSHKSSTSNSSVTDMGRVSEV